MGTEAIGFENGVVFGVFVDVAMLCYRQSEKKPAKAPLTQKYGCVVAPMPPWLRHGAGAENWAPFVAAAIMRAIDSRDAIA